MRKLAIAFVVFIILAFLLKFTSPGVPLIRRILPSLGAPRQHAMNPPYMFHVVDANTQLNLP
jgi:hypothetical protein